MRRLTLVTLGASLGLLGCAEPEVRDDAARTTWFVEVAAERGLHFEHRSGHDGEHHLLPEITCGGAALFDADDDGDLDAYLVQGGGPTHDAAQRPPNRFFINEGGGYFRDDTEDSGAGHRGHGSGVACGDADGDGSTDLFVTNVGPDVLLLNDGKGRFREAAGVDDDGYGTSAAFVDFDRDGDLDLFVVRYVDWRPEAERECPGRLGGPDYCLPAVYDAPSSDLLWRNEGDGRYQDVSVTTGIARALGPGLGVVPSDVDGDGWVDLFVANDGQMDRLWSNRRGRSFVDVALLLGVAVDEEGQAKAGMGVAAADLDDDGDEELLVVNLAAESDSLFLNEVATKGVLRDVTPRSGLAGASRRSTRFGVGFADFDHDGWLDLFEANGRVTRPPRLHGDDPYAEDDLVLKGGEGPRFTLLDGRNGLAAPSPATSRAAAFGDVDDDGRVDVLVVDRDGPARLLLGSASVSGDWHRFDLRDRQGRPALDARLAVTVGERTLHRVLRAAGSYQASSDPRIHVALGDGAVASDLLVSWPDGTQERFPPPSEVGDRVLRQGSGRPVR
ncbi:MAG: CRTAC1 family protein [Acidobacteriota bacterium]